MAFDYSKFETLALDQITDKGRNVTLRIQTNTYDPATSTNTQTNVDQVVKAVFTEFMSKQIDGTIVKEGDKKLLIATKGLTTIPTTDHQVLDGTVVWRIVHIAEVQPGGTSVLLKLQVRR